MHNVLITNPNISEVGVSILRKFCDIYYTSLHDEETLIHLINKYCIDVIFIQNETITSNIIKNCPSLKIIQVNGINLNSVECAVASKYGIKVLNTINFGQPSLSEHTIALLLALSRNMILIDQQAREKDIPFPYPDEYRTQREVEKKGLYIIGFGDTGKHVSQKAQALGMIVKAYDPYVSNTYMELYGTEKILDLMEGLRWGDYISIHTPYTPLTHCLISNEQFHAMKKEAFFVNVSCKGLVDEKALYSALMSNKIAGAGLGVYDEKLLHLDKRIIELKNLLLSPCNSKLTKSCLDKTSKYAAESILNALNVMTLNNQWAKEM